MAIWTSEIKELEKLYESLKGQSPDLEKELERLIKADDENMILLYSRRCLEVIITDLCECELKRPRKTEPLKGIIDRLHKEDKVPAHIITSMHGLNELSTYGAHPKDFDPEQVKPVLVNLDIIIKWYLKYKDFQIVGKAEPEEEKYESKHPAVSPEEKSIIVLPFENISSDPEQEYFSDGLTEEIITDLSYIKDLLVISRSSAMTFKNSNKKIKDIASEVNVKYVLEGSVRKAGNSLRIAAQLIDGKNDSHIWAEKYTGTFEDVFDIQEKVSRSIADALKLHLTPEEALQIAEKPITDLRAYECYLRAISALDRITESAIYEAIRNLELALQIVGENVVLYYGLGYAYWCFANQGIAIDENLSKCKEYAKKALTVDSGSTKALALLGFADVGYSDWKHAQEAHLQLKQVLEQDPNDSLALLGLSIIVGCAGKIPEAMSLHRRYAEREPMSIWTYILPFYLYLIDGQFEHGLELWRRAMKTFPYPPLEAELAWALAWTGRNEEAIAQADRSAKDAPNLVHTKLALMLKYGLQGDVTSARAELTPGFYEWCYRGNTWSYFLAGAFSLANAKEDAMEWLEHAVDLGWISYPLLAEKDPFLANIRKDARFKELLKRVKYEWETFEA
jgi:non-specific serine/threonine protein kinase